MQIVLVILLSVLFGFFQKIADALDEHGLKLFKGAPIFFGIIWGIIGAYLVYSYQPLASWFIGLILYWIVRGKIDYVNHALSVGIIVIVYFVRYSFFFDYLALGVFASLFLTHLLVSALGFKRKAYVMLVVPFAYSMFIMDPVPFVSVTSTVIAIELTKYHMRRKGIKT